MGIIVKNTETEVGWIDEFWVAKIRLTVAECLIWLIGGAAGYCLRVRNATWTPFYVRSVTVSSWTVPARCS